MRTAPAPMLMLSKLVRDSGFKVVMTGEGADEVFAGYDVFKEAKVRRFCAAQPHSKRRPHAAASRLYPYMPRLQGQSQRYLEAFFGGQQSALDDPLYSHLPRFRTSAGAKAFFSRRPARADRQATTRSPTCASACRPTSCAGIRCRSRSIWKAPTCCPATSSPRRATASAWRTPSRALPVPRPPPDRACRAHPAAPEAQGARREAHPARRA